MTRLICMVDEISQLVLTAFVIDVGMGTGSVGV